MANKALIIRAPFKELFLILACFVINHEALAQINLDKIAHSDGWKALLYYQNQSLIVTDPKFYLSADKTLKSELAALLSELTTERKQEIICRFPARYFFLVQKMDYPEAPLEKCEKLTEFKIRAPLEKAYIMFASENISVPSSMMGHIYLKIAGLNHKKKYVEHAISFYTDVDGINFPKLVFESLVLGKKGFYALAPGEPLKNNYLHLEGRNVWEFELKLTNQQKAILHNHLFELKNIKLTYYFHTFNCATLINHIIRVAHPAGQNTGIEWTTPLDVVRYIEDHHLINTQAVNLSNKWKIKSLIESSDFEPLTLELIKKNKIPDLIKHSIEHEQSYAFKALELSRSYNNFLLSEKSISKRTHDKKVNELNHHLESFFPNSRLNFNSYKNPTKTKSTAQLMASYANEKNESIFQLTFLPASHFLEDDSSNYISESELQISRLTIGHNTRRNNFFVDEFNLYSATSFLPADTLTDGLSGKFRLGYLNYFNSRLEREKSLIVEGKLGKTYRLHNDLDFFGLLGLSFLEANEVLLSPDVESGFILRAILDMKIIFSIGYLSEDVFKNQGLVTSRLKHFIDLGDYGILFEYEHLRNQKNDLIDNYSLGVKRYF